MSRMILSLNELQIERERLFGARQKLVFTNDVSTSYRASTTEIIDRMSARKN